VTIKNFKPLFIFSCTSFCITTYAQSVVSNDFDSCKVFAISYSAMYRMRIYPENLIYDFNDTSFIVDKASAEKVLNVIDTFQTRIVKQDNNKPFQNMYRVDYRLLFLYYKEQKINLVGFGANGLMAINDTVYKFDKNILKTLTTVIPGLKPTIRL
jgi:hypothetical protein